MGVLFFVWRLIMNEVMIDNSKIENMIYEIRGKHVMFNSEVSATK
mgnify:FL=1